MENKTAVVTGGGSGIGRAIARRFAEEGARVIIVGRTEATLKETAAADGEEGLKCLRSPRVLRELTSCPAGAQRAGEHSACAHSAYGGARRCARRAYRARPTKQKTRRAARLVRSTVNLPPRGGDTDKFILSFLVSSNVFFALFQKNTGRRRPPFF
ncbi:MAG TPA: SDR family NAD(P)-dependent oxidoreductase [Candidatus Limadaptatus stercorigallinarum]|uniref:SDR family NAD(P)-dependent oxidoreductase n=1 Tax=Candidatus Limadaptatus stercorigallinarum TaxID=2840845 RepID=A0A9D1HSU2_9FIRM|nr:SDR family NAD(P)-dependent oxidoreductase [Candidatus Limadaptatus stercorigallinarum]